MSAYKEQSDPGLITDIHARKEFAQLWVPEPEEDFRVGPEGSLGSMEPQTHQQFVRNFMNPHTPNMRMHLMHSTGCHAPGTMIRVFGGLPKAVEALALGDMLVHPDGGATRICSLHHGTDEMFRIVPKVHNGRVHQTYDVNAGHILHLGGNGGCLYDVSVRDYIRYNLSAQCEMFLLYRHAETRVEDERVSFSLVRIGVGEYYGFTLQGAKDGLFLGTDGLILHNSGKCLGRGTPVRTSRGIIPVEDIRVDDCLVGDDGGPRFIESLAHGMGQCFRVTGGSDFRSFICNYDHILSLWDIRQCMMIDCSIVDIHKGKLHPLDKSPGRRKPPERADDSYFSPLALRGYRIVRIDPLLYCEFTIEPVGVQEYFGFTLKGETNGRFLLGDGTVTHNTRAAISAAQECVKLYRYIYRAANWRDASLISPSIFVIAFGGKHAFIRDLIKYPEFGYATAAEYETYLRLYRESVENDEAYQKFNDFFSSLKRRATTRAKGGFYKMIGYDEFANRLFGADVVKLNTVIQEAHSHHELYSVALERAIAHGDIKPNASLLARLENSMIIADELHNTYNSQTINNRGLAIQYVLDHVNGIRFLSLSATPINSVPAEICDFINYFVTPGDKVMRESLFSGNTLLPGAIDRINELLRGHVSFLYDFDPRYFPRRLDQGISLTVRDQSLPYLKFIPCVMSEFFVNTIKAFYQGSKEPMATSKEPMATSKEPATSSEPATGTEEETVKDDLDVDDEIIGIPQNAYALFDMVFPNPASDSMGLYSSATLFGTIHSAPQAWKNSAGIVTKTTSGLRTFSGSFLRTENLARYSAKYARVVPLITQIIRETGPCKIMIYHDRVRMTGVLLIREILRENGMIDEHDEATDGTMCAICTKPRSEHAAGSKEGSPSKSGHEFRPLRFATLYSELDKGTLNSIRERFNSPMNMHGEWCSILIGSKLIREGYDFVAIRHLIVLSLPISISQLIQVFGRCVRRGSHMRLPENERDVRIHILVNVVNHHAGVIDDVANAPEIRRYVLKLGAYLIVQKIERELARGAIDAGINRNIISRPDKDSLGLLLYDEAVRFTLPTDGKDLHVDTFFAYGYGSQEIQFAIEIIKRLFHHRSVWKADELVSTIRKPPFGVWSNPALIADSSITIALSFLLSAAGNTIGVTDRAIMISGVPHLIVASSQGSSSESELEGNLHGLNAGDYLFLAPVETVEIAGIARSRALIDVESFIRGTQYETEDAIPIDQYELRTSFEESILAILRAEFKDVPVPRGKITTEILLQMKSFLTRFSTDQQRIVVQHFIENEEMRREFPILFKFLDALGVFVPFKYASKYKDIARRFDATFAGKIDPAAPIAFGDGAAVRLYTGTEWISIGRSALNMHVEFDENETLVGIFRQFPYVIKFQLREPIQKLRAQRSAPSGRHRDARTIERGSVCVTKSREAIEHDAQRLGLTMREIRAALTANELCLLIQAELLRSEIEERKDPHSLIKYVYGWWNAIPSPF